MKFKVYTIFLSEKLLLLIKNNDVKYFLLQLILAANGIQVQKKI